MRWQRHRFRFGGRCRFGWRRREEHEGWAEGEEGREKGVLLRVGGQHVEAAIGEDEGGLQGASTGADLGEDDRRIGCRMMQTFG